MNMDDVYYPPVSKLIIQQLCMNTGADGYFSNGSVWMYLRVSTAMFLKVGAATTPP